MKRLIKLLSVFVAFVAALSLVACAGDSGNDGKKKKESEIYGTFTYQETLGSRQGDLVLTSNTQNTGRHYLHATVFPVNNGNEGAPIAYAMDQRLKLNRNFTYKYDYTILMTNPQAWGGQIARLTVSITGVYESAPSDNGVYSVLLSNPTGGTLTVVSFQVTGGGTYGMAIHSQNDYVVDYAIMSTVEGYKYDKYVASRVVSVERETKSLTDDVFYQDLFDFIALYSTY
ncbi:MAG: hypothetical protein J1G38_04915 [Clostridiales bacterium]|nr:hypothetical protein [Clostridiales bacterium]